MRIGIVHNWYRSAQPSGENTVVRQQAAALAAAGHEVRMFTADSDRIAGSATAALTVPASVVWSPGSRRALRAGLDQWCPDVLHVHNTFPLLSPSVLGVARSAGVPVVVSLHNFRLVCANGVLELDGQFCTRCFDPAFPLPALRHRCYRGSAVSTAPLAVNIATHRALGTWTRNTALFTVPSRFVRDLYVRAGFPRRQIVVKPQSVEIPAAVRAAGTESGAATGSGRQVFAYLGRLTEHKGVDALLAAWSDEFGDLVLIGDGPLRAAAQQRADRDGSVHVRGPKPWPEAMAELARADVVVAPSKTVETFGMTVIEAYALGLPVIGSRAGGMAELLDPAAAIAIEPGDVTGLRAALARLSDPVRCASMGRAAAVLHADRYSAAAEVSALEQIYSDAAARTGGTRE